MIPFIAFLILLTSSLIADQFEGIYPDPIEKKIYLMDRFLTFDPTIVLLDCTSEDEKTCRRQWPNSTVFFADPLDLNQLLDCDLLWVDSEGAELYYLEKAAVLLQKAKVVFTSTHFTHKGAYYQKQKNYLESFGFRLLGHWYGKEQGKAIFVRRELLEASLRSLNYYPASSTIPPYHAPSFQIERFLQPAKNKSSIHQIEGIDFIYMINLDERPEKFALASSALQQFGIFPYRFSAVNGWKLPAEAFQQLGVKFAPGMIQENFLGTTYRQANGRSFMSNEYLKENGDTYYTLGLSPGAIGIVLSHLSILQDAYSSGFRTIWVMEDDVEAIDDPRQIPQLIRQLDAQVDDWDVLFTDIDTKNGNGVHVPCRAIAARPNRHIEPLADFFSRFYPISPEFSRIGMRYGAYSMIIRRSGMEKILNYFKTYSIYLPYDMDFWLVPNIKLYSVNKDIVSHRPGAPSDNSAPFYKEKK